MDLLPLVFSRRRRRLLLAGAAAIASGYGAYKLYRHPAVARQRRAASCLFRALVAVASATSAASDAVAIVSSDLVDFLRSESDEIPASIRQMSKIARSDEFSGSLSTVSEALVAGISQGVGSVSDRPSNGRSNIPDRILDKLISGAGAGLASAVVGSFARGLVMGLVEDSSSDTDAPSNRDPSAAAPEWIQLMCRDESRELIGECVNTFVGTAVAVYLDKTMDINFYDDIFAGLTNRKHEAEMKGVLVSLCNGAVETLVRTSHQVLTNANSNSTPGGSLSNVGNPIESVELLAGDAKRSSFDHKRDGGGDGWVDQVTSTLAKTSNRMFILDVTGRITFETVRSFLDFVLLQMSEATKKGLSAVRADTAARGRAVLRFFTAKSMIIALICLCLCMHCMIGYQVWAHD